jgi:hypothetical protein
MFLHAENSQHSIPVKMAAGAFPVPDNLGSPNATSGPRRAGRLSLIPSLPEMAVARRAYGSAEAAGLNGFPTPSPAYQATMVPKGSAAQE